MGLFSNLFGNEGKDLDNALNKMKNLADDIIDDGQVNSSQNRPVTPVAGAEPLNSRRPESVVEANGPSGDSWGPVMPSEENQYNSGLPYKEYFTKILTESFPSYQIEREAIRDGSDYVFTFIQSGSKKLVIEVRSTKSSRYKLRNDCRKAGIPYLRFYYDYDGWWNTKSYVIRRAKEALGV